jgi:ketosteroid isomerase-like protein
MSSIRFLLLGTIVSGMLACRQGTPEREITADKRDTGTDKQDVTQVGEREARAVSAGNVDSNLAVLTRDVVMMPPGERVLTGTDPVRSWLRRIHDQYTLNLRYTGSEVDVVGDWAIQRYTFVATATPKKGGKPTEDRGKGIHIYRRQPDGSWLIAQDVWNSDPASSRSP